MVQNGVSEVASAAEDLSLVSGDLPRVVSIEEYYGHYSNWQYTIEGGWSDPVQRRTRANVFLNPENALMEGQIIRIELESLSGKCEQADAGKSMEDTMHRRSQALSALVVTGREFVVSPNNLMNIKNDFSFIELVAWIEKFLKHKGVADLVLSEYARSDKE